MNTVLTRESPENRLRVADLYIDNVTKEVKRGNKGITLTPKEFELLFFLMENAGRVLPRELILDKIWHYTPEMESRVVDVYIGYLRQKIDVGFRKKLIRSIRGFGYTIKK